MGIADHDERMDVRDGPKTIRDQLPHLSHDFLCAHALEPNTIAHRLVCTFAARPPYVIKHLP